MKFSCQVDVDLPLDKFIGKWDSNENLKYGQDQVLRYEEWSEEPGKKGAKTLYIYKQGRGEMEITETIILNDIPRSFVGLYEHKHMTNTMINKFEVLTENKTRWSATIEYTRFSGILPKLLGLLFPKMFQKQTQKWLDQFKEFAEKVI